MRISETLPLLWLSVCLNFNVNFIKQMQLNSFPLILVPRR
jgi:hypothetical protein